MYISAYIGGKPCGCQVFERNRDLECRIKQAFQVQGGCEMSVESVLSCLDFGPDKRIFILRQAKEYFPGIYTRRERRGSCKQYPFQCTL